MLILYIIIYHAGAGSHNIMHIASHTLHAASFVCGVYVTFVSRLMRYMLLQCQWGDYMTFVIDPIDRTSLEIVGKTGRYPAVIKQNIVLTASIWLKELYYIQCLWIRYFGSCTAVDVALQPVVFTMKSYPDGDQQNKNRLPGLPIWMSVLTKTVHAQYWMPYIFDQWVVLSRIHLRNAIRPGDKWSTLYEISEWNLTTWQFMAISVPPGLASIIFEFQMGFPSECAAAIDQVEIMECTRDMDVKHGFLRDGKSPYQYHTQPELGCNVVYQVI